jgi:hypothetical protein
MLLLRQFEPHRASAHADPVFNRLTTSKVKLSTAVPGQIKNLQFTLKYEVARQGSLAVLLQERHRPATLRQHELHQHPRSHELMTMQNLDRWRFVLSAEDVS